MPDREQVIYDIERCICHVPDACKDCSHYQKEEAAIDCMEILLTDALALLREQEPEPILYRDNHFTGLPVATCPKCGRFARQFHSECPGEETKFCPWCGRAVKWDADGA